MEHFASKLANNNIYILGGWRLIKELTSVMDATQNNNTMSDTFYGFFFNKLVTITKKDHTISIPVTASVSVLRIPGLFTENFTYLPLHKNPNTVQGQSL